MACRSCVSGNQTDFGAEINIHFPGLEGIEKPAVWVFPKLTVCMDCGYAEFVIPENELRRLAKDAAA
jgi:hypothetical protein